MFRQTAQLHNYNLKAKTTQVSYTSDMSIGNLWPAFIPHWQRKRVS